MLVDIEPREKRPGRPRRHHRIDDPGAVVGPLVRRQNPEYLADGVAPELGDCGSLARLEHARTGFVPRRGRIQNWTRRNLHPGERIPRLLVDRFHPALLGQVDYGTRWRDPDRSLHGLRKISGQFARPLPVGQHEPDLYAAQSVHILGPKRHKAAGTDLEPRLALIVALQQDVEQPWLVRDNVQPGHRRTCPYARYRLVEAVKNIHAEGFAQVLQPRVDFRSRPALGHHDNALASSPAQSPQVAKRRLFYGEPAALTVVEQHQSGGTGVQS